MRNVIEDHRLYESVTANRTLRALLETDSALHSERRGRDVLHIILEGVRAAGFDRARLYVMSSDGAYMNVAAHIGMDESFIGTRWAVTDPLHTFFETPGAKLYKRGVKGSPDFERFLEAEGVEEWACAPLLYKGQLIGILSADTAVNGRQIRNENLLPLALFAAQAIVALETNIYAEIEKRIRDLQSILEIYTSISSTLHLDNILKTACRSALHLIGLEQCWLMLVTPDFEKGILRAAYPKGLMVRGSEVSLENSSIKEAIVKLRKHLIVPDIERDTALGSLRDLLKENGTRSCLMVPVISKGKVLGVFGLDSLRQVRTFGEEEIKLCKVVAAQLGVAIENARLYAEAERRASQLESLRQTTLAVMSAQRREDLLRTIIEHAIKLLNGKSGGIYQYHPELGELEIIADYNRPKNIGRRLKVGEGMAGRLVQSDESFMRVPNYNEWEGKSDIYQGERLFVSVLEVPLKLNNRTVGVLYIDDEAGRDFTDEEAYVLGLFADQASIAIENTRLVEQLNEQQMLLDSFISNMPDGLIAVDMRGRLTKTNPRARAILGYGADEDLPAEVCRIYFDPDEARRIDQKLSESNGRIEYPTFLMSKDGHAIPVRLFVSTLPGANNERKGSVGYFEDLRSDFQTNLLLKACGIIAKAETLNKGLQDLADMLVKLLSASFCRVLLLDESGKYLTVKAAYPTTRDDQLLEWQDRLGERIALAEYEGLREVVYGVKPRVLRQRNKKSRPWLEKYSKWLGFETTVQSLLMIPLRVGDTVAGLLTVGELRKEERSPFTKDKSELAAGIAGQVAALIDRSRLQEATNRRNHLLTVLTESAQHIRGDEDPEKLLPEFVRLATDLIGYKGGGLYIYRTQLDSLELKHTYGQATQVTEEYLAHVEELVANVARTRQSLAVNESSDFRGRDSLLSSNIRIVVAVPLKLATGEVEAVFFAINDEDKPAFVELEIESLERFSELTVNALQTSRAMTLSQRMVGKVSLLHQISEYAQENQDIGKTIDALLTGITAGYGLGFNRAVMIQLEESNSLIGVKGVGHLSREEACKAWESVKKIKPHDFKAYIDQLDQGLISSTPLGEHIHNFQSFVSAESGDAFSRIVIEKKARILKPEELDELPENFREIFQPTSEVILIPLMARKELIGIIAADNKFIQRPITKDDVESLLTFANAGALAIDNIRLYKSLDDSGQRLKALFKASSTLISSDNPNKILQNIVDQTLQEAGAAWARVILIDQSRRAHTLVSAGCDDALGCDEIVRPDGIALRVMRTGLAEVIENTHEKRDQLNPYMLKPHPEALLCLPLSLQGRPFGVTWISYPRPRKFSEFEVEALQLYANQAAVAYDSSRRMKILGHMQRAAALMAGASDPVQILHQIVDSARIVLRAHSAALWPYDPSSKRFIDKGYVASNIPDELMTEFIKNEPRPGGTAYTVMGKGWLPVEDVGDLGKYEFLGGSTRGLLMQLGVRSFIGVSLVEGDENLGVLYVNYDQPLDLDEEELRIARTFANYAVLELKKAKLLEESKKANEQLSRAFKQLSKAQGTARVVAQVTALGQPRYPLRSVVQGTKAALNCDAVTLYTYDDDRKEFDYPPEMVGVRHEAEVIKLGHVTKESVVRDVLKLSSLYVSPDTPSDQLLGKAFARREGIASSVGIPLSAGGRPVGVMFVNFRTPHEFTADELTSIDLFAKQAAVAIRNEQLYKRVNKRAGLLRVLHESGRDITSSLDLNKILSRLAEQACKLASYESEQVSFVDIKLVEGAKMFLAAAYPREEELKIRAMLGKEIDLKKGIGGRIGVLGRAIRDGNSQYVKNVRTDPDYLELHEETQSQVVVLIEKNDKIIGAISVEHPELDAFDEETISALKLLAAQASVAIENARQYQEIDKTKTKIAAQTSLAWMGMASSTWRHAITGHAITISGEIDMLCRELPGGVRAGKVNERLSKIKRLATMIQEKPVTATLSPVGAKPLSINDWVKVRLAHLWENEPYTSVNLRVELEEGNSLPVRIHSDWLRQVFDILIDNAINAMASCPLKQLTVTTTLNSEQAEIRITDTGVGIPPELLKTLFQVQVPKTDGGRGLGMGLLMAQTILQAYSGEIRVGQTSPEGTTMIVRLPLAF